MLFSKLEGLNANEIYNCVQDKKGFLWLATNIGAIRFDGKYFQMYTTEDGLPDNEVLKVLLDKQGKIWVHTFKQTTAYFDNLQNKFVSERQDSILQSIHSKRLLYTFSTIDGEIEFCSEYNTSIVKDKKILQLPCSKKLLYTYVLSAKNINNYTYLNNVSGYELSLDFVNNNKVAKRIALCDFVGLPKNNDLIVDEYKIYLVVKDNLFSFTIDCENKKLVEVWTTKFKNGIQTISMSKNFIIVFNNINQLEIYDKHSKKLIQIINNLPFINHVYESNSNQLWLSGKNGELILFNTSSIENLNVEKKYFTCLSKSNDNKMYFGTNSNLILEKNNATIIPHLIAKSQQLPQYQRAIIGSQNKIFSFSDGGVYENFLKPILNPQSNKPIVAKCAVALNDSIIVIGSIDKMYLLNTKKTTLKIINNNHTRVTSICKKDNQTILYGSTNGLHKFDIQNFRELSIENSNQLLKERITTIGKTGDGNIWIGTAGQGIYVLKNNKIIKQFTKAIGLLDNAITCITSDEKNNIYCGTFKGASKIIFLKDSFQIQNITKLDGLVSNHINAIYCLKDTTFFATDDGISYLNENIKPIKNEIKTFLLNIKVNQKNIFIDSIYTLKTNENNIQLQFSASALNGYFKQLEMSRNQGETWILMNNNELNLELNSGKHTLWIRAIDIQNQPSDHILKLIFEVATPFYRTWWFILGSFLCISALTFKFYFKRINTKHEQRLEKIKYEQTLTELELQALKAQMNPHFVFNCLNSIKGYIYNNDADNAEKYLDKFAKLLRNTLDYSSQKFLSLETELNYIENYLQLEQLRFKDKFIFEIRTENKLDTKNVKIPSMLLQPYIENAIKHGVCASPNNKGVIIINASMQNNLLSISIDDNGLGIDHSKSTSKHTSMGMSITKRRLDLYNINLEIIDKQSNGLATFGTIIKLLIPLNL